MRTGRQCIIGFGLLSVCLCAPAALAQTWAGAKDYFREDADGQKRYTHNAIEERRRRIEDLKTKHRRSPENVPSARRLAYAYLDAGQGYNAIGVLSETMEKLGQKADDPRALEIQVALAEVILNVATPDYPNLVDGEHFDFLYQLVTHSRTDSPWRHRALYLIARFHRLARRIPQSDHWWDARMQVIQKAYPELDLSKWRRESDSFRRHTARAFNATRSLFNLDSSVIQEELLVEAYLLHAVCCMDLHLYVDAYTAFLKAFELMPDGPDRNAFVSSDLIAGEDERAELHTEEERSAFTTQHWYSKNPNPGYMVNTAELEFWKRVAAARMTYGSPEQWGGAGHPARVLIALGEFDDSWIEPMRSDMDAQKAAASMTGAIRFEPMRRVERRGNSTLAYNQAGSFAYSLEAGSAGLVESLTAAEPVLLPTGQVNPAPFFVDYVPVAGEEHVSFALLPWRENENWWKGATVEVRLFDENQIVVGEPRRYAVRKDHIFASPLGSMLLGAEVFSGLGPGEYQANMRVHTTSMRINYSYPIVRRTEMEESSPYRRRPLKITGLEFALGEPPREQGPQFNRPGFSYVPNPSRLVDCRDGKACDLSVVFNVENVSVVMSDGVRMADLSALVQVLPQEWYAYRKHRKWADDLEEPPIACKDLEEQFRRRAVCNPETNRQDEDLFTDSTLLEHWVTRRDSALRTLRPVHRNSRVTFPARVDVSQLEAGSYVLYVRVWDQAAQERLRIPSLDTIGYRPVPFHIIRDSDPI